MRPTPHLARGIAIGEPLIHEHVKIWGLNQGRCPGTSFTSLVRTTAPE